MSKIYHLSFSILQKVMLITAVHWFLIAIWHVSELNSIAIIAFVGLVYLAYRYRNLLEKAYHWLMQHKFLIMLAV